MEHTMMHVTRWMLALSAGLAAVAVSPASAAENDLGGPRCASPTVSLVVSQPAATDSTTENTVVFHVPTITCSACPLRVEASVRKAPGILDVTFSGQDVTVTYDPSVVTPDAIAAAIEAGGDSVEPVAA
jgi:copper chaperone CopZ